MHCLLSLSVSCTRNESYRAFFFKKTIWLFFLRAATALSFVPIALRFYFIHAYRIKAPLCHTLFSVKSRTFLSNEMYTIARMVAMLAQTESFICNILLYYRIKSNLHKLGATELTGIGSSTPFLHLGGGLILSFTHFLRVFFYKQVLCSLQFRSGIFYILIYICGIVLSFGFFQVVAGKNEEKVIMM